MDLTERTKYDWLLQLSDYRCPITANCPITILQKNKTATVPITFEEIVMVVINYGIEYDVESRGFRG